MVQKLLRKARKGARVIYVPGNHDESLRDYSARISAASRCANDAIHVDRRRRRLLVIHGDAFDVVVQHARWLAHARRLGLRAGAAASTPASTSCAAALGFSYWSLSAWAEDRSRTRSTSSAASSRRWPRRPRAPRRRRRGLRPHPQRRDARRSTASPIQRRRLGGELHRAGRASRRPARDHRMAGSTGARGPANCSIGRLPTFRTPAWRRAAPPETP